MNILIGAQVFCWPKIINPLGHKTILRPSAEGWFCVLRWKNYNYDQYFKCGNYLRAETYQGRKLFVEIQYFKSGWPWFHLSQLCRLGAFNYMTKFYPTLTPSPPRVNKHGHLFALAPDRHIKRLQLQDSSDGRQTYEEKVMSTP